MWTRTHRLYPVYFVVRAWCENHLAVRNETFRLFVLYASDTAHVQATYKKFINQMCFMFRLDFPTLLAMSNTTLPEANVNQSTNQTQQINTTRFNSVWKVIPIQESRWKHATTKYPRKKCGACPTLYYPNNPSACAEIQCFSKIDSFGNHYPGYARNLRTYSGAVGSLPHLLVAEHSLCWHSMHGQSDTV